MKFRNKLSLTFILTFSLLLTYLSHAEDIDLSSAQKMALDQNPKIKQMEADMEIGSASKLKALSPHIPQLSLNARHLFAEKFQTQTTTLGTQRITLSVKEPYTDVYFMGTWMIFDGFSTWNQFESSKSLHNAANSLYEYSKLQIEEDIFMKFHAVLAQKALIEVAKQNVKTLEQHLNDVSGQIRGGIATQLDKLKVEVQLEDAKTEFLLSQDNYEIALSRLYQAIGMEPSVASTQVINGNLPIINREKLLSADFSPKEREDFKALKEKENSSNSLLRASYGQWAPKVSLFLKEDIYNYSNHSLTYNKENFPQSAYSFGILLTWNFFDGGLTYANNLIAREQLKKTKEELRAFKLAMPVDIENWKRKLIHSAASYEAALVSIKKATESIRLSKNAVLAGTRTNTDVLDAERDLYLSKSKMIKAQLEAIEALANLELALGKKLYVF